MQKLKQNLLKVKFSRSVVLEVHSYQKGMEYSLSKTISLQSFFIVVVFEWWNHTGNHFKASSAKALRALWSALHLFADVISGGPLICSKCKSAYLNLQTTWITHLISPESSGWYIFSRAIKQSLGSAKCLTTWLKLSTLLNPSILEDLQAKLCHQLYACYFLGYNGIAQV